MTKLKRISAILLAAALVVSTLAFSVSAEGEPTASVMYGTPEAIDGVLDDKWAGSVKVENTFGAINTEAANYHVQQGWQEVTQVSASMRAMWDEGNLYLFFDVQDPTVGTAEEGSFQECPPDAAGSLWQRNTIQLFIDWGDEGHNSGRNSGYDGNDCKVQLNSRGATDYFYGSWFNNCAEFETVVTETGYTMEIAIEYSKFASTYNFVPEAGKSIGLGFIVCDSDAWFTWHRDSFCGWGVSDLLQDWPNQMGILTLEAKPGYPTATAAYGTPGAIDGAYDNGWKNAVKVSNTYGSTNPDAVSYHAQQGWLEVTQVSADMRAMWDESNLYLLFDVADPTVGTAEEGSFQECPPDAAGSLWQRNTIQLIIDWGDEGHNSGISLGYDGHDCKVQLNSRGATD
ncbi:MAG: hypothetical protein J6Z80_03275, partial [Clostridia bacterium]|nr:hypothetical protein [Clostridia bacterium]